MKLDSYELEKMIDKYGLAMVLQTIAEICRNRAVIEEKKKARCLEIVAKKIENISTDFEI